MYAKIDRISPARCLIWLLLLAFLASGCASIRRGSKDDADTPETQITEEVEAEQIDANDADTPEATEEIELDQADVPATATDWSPQMVRAGSLLNIKVYVGGNREVDIQNTRVSDNGRIRLPLVGSVFIAGYSIPTITEFLEIRYSDYFVSPQVSIDIVRAEDGDSFPWGFVTVLGRVQRQGRVAIPPTRDLTVSSAIQQAGGFDTSARIRSIRVTRQLPDGESETFNVNMRNIGRRGRTDQDIQLKPNDVVFVPEKLF